MLLDREGCAAWLGVSARTLDTLRTRPGFPELRLGDSPRFEPDAVLAWIRTQGVE
ncbi:MAG TPA: hypothetical protein VHU80_17065 [Polyangiaceae bacterium]|nr:hypothetical protein [Polyangiaceae bacterium]